MKHSIEIQRDWQNDLNVRGTKFVTKHQSMQLFTIDTKITMEVIDDSNCFPFQIETSEGIKTIYLKKK